MFIVTLQDKPEGVYSVYDDNNNRVVPIFEQEDDADRYLEMLDFQEGIDLPQMEILEIEGQEMINACQQRGQRFLIITPDDLLIPPEDRA
tara:strand:+ start:1908 stop:2177 length:270 start_codon:yes stop_codon:yes gene_type:complete